MTRVRDKFEQYVHTLVPRNAQFAPQPKQVVRFFAALSALAASPRDPEIVVMKPSDRLRRFTDPLTGERRSAAAHDRTVLRSIDGVAPLIAGLQDYSVALEGEGPPAVAPFPLHANGILFTGTYGYRVRCCLRPEPVSMSEPGEGEVETALRFGDPCGPQNGIAVLNHSVSGRIISVLDAGCAQFWLEFEFGKWLMPEINESPGVLNSAITSIAEKSFGTSLAQGFRVL